MIREYQSIAQINWPLLTVRGVRGIACGEAAELELAIGEIRPCKVLEIRDDTAVLLLFGRPDGIRLHGSKVRFLGHGWELGVSEDLLGRVFSGLGTPVDGGPDIIPEFQQNVTGIPVNPLERLCPAEPVLTSVSAIDPQPLLRGQTLPVVSDAALPHAEFAARIIRQAALDSGTDTAIVFAAIGSSFPDYKAVVQSFRHAGLLDRTVIFANLAGDPVSERILTPKLAMTAAEYLAFDQGLQVFVLLSDMTNYAEVLRELAAAKKEPTDNLGYPHTLRDSFAALYERAGLRRDCTGSITMLPVLTVAGENGAHPVWDLMAAITEQQLVLTPGLCSEGASDQLCG